MARPPSVSYQEVAAACIRLTAAGSRVNQRTVRAELNTSASTTTLLRYIETWVNEHKPTVAGPAELSAPVQQSILAFAAEQVAAAVVDLQCQLVDRDQAIDDLVSENERLQALLEEQTNHVQLLSASNAELTGRVKQLEQNLADERDACTAQRQAAEDARFELAMALQRLATLPLLEADLAAVRAQYQDSDLVRQSAERTQAVAQADASRSRELLNKQETALVQRDEALVALREELQAALTRVAHLEGSLNERQRLQDVQQLRAGTVSSSASRDRKHPGL